MASNECNATEIVSPVEITKDIDELAAQFGAITLREVETVKELKEVSQHVEKQIVQTVQNVQTVTDQVQKVINEVIQLETPDVSESQVQLQFDLPVKTSLLKKILACFQGIACTNPKILTTHESVKKGQ